MPADPIHIVAEILQGRNPTRSPERYANWTLVRINKEVDRTVQANLPGMSSDRLATARTLLANEGRFPAEVRQAVTAARGRADAEHGRRGGG